MTEYKVTGEDLFERIPQAVWTPGRPLPYVYRGSPIEMVEQMAAEMGPEVTPEDAIAYYLDALAKHRHLRIQINGDPPKPVLAGIFVYMLLQHGVCRPMPQA